MLVVFSSSASQDLKKNGETKYVVRVQNRSVMKCKNGNICYSFGWLSALTTKNTAVEQAE